MSEPPDNVVVLPVETTLDLTPDRVLGAAVGQLDAVVVVGREPGGRLYFAASSADAAQVLWLLELARQQLLEVAR